MATMQAVKEKRGFMFTRRHVQIALGCLWLLDGLLQFQHQMFTSAFVTQVIAPAAAGQPIFVAGPMHFFMHIFLMHPALFNLGPAIGQSAIGLAILWKRTAKWGLIASVVWGLFVWAVGEGYGGIFGWQTSLIMGAPGAALIYVILALASLPPKDSEQQASEEPAAFWLVFAWMLFWVGGELLQLTAKGMNTTADIKSMVLSNASGVPAWMANVDAGTASFINKFGTYTKPMALGQHMSMMQMAQMPIQSGSGGWFVVLLSIVMLFVGLGVFLRGKVRTIAITLGIILSLIFWVVGEQMGTYYSGTATDPNSGPLFVVLGIAILGCTNLDVCLGRFARKVQDIIV